MDGIRQEQKIPVLHVLIGFVIVVGILYIARDIFVPIAIAILLSFLLAPLVRRLTKWRFPNVAAVLTTVLLAVCVISVIAWLVSAQFINLVDNLPRYQDNLRAKISTVLSSNDDSVIRRATETLDTLSEEIEQEVGEEQPPATEATPIPVQIQQPPPGPFQTLRQFAGPVLGPLGTAGITFIFVVFILLQRNDLRDRFIKLVSGGNLNLATQAVDDATRRISRYLLMHTIINVAYGVPVAIGLYFIGVPNALLWGLLATLLRFIPFIGAWISALFPISLAIAVDPGWTMPLLTIALIVTLELFSNNVLEPWLYGSSTGISIVALLFAALVWTWIWGPIGLFLSTPLTVCLLVIGRNAPAFNFLNVILGTEPVLEPRAQLYQRMLAMDAESLFELAEREVENSSLANFYDQVLIPALAMAESDRHAGLLAEHRQEFINHSTRELLEDFREQYVEDAAPALGPQVLCVPARDEADRLSAMMCAHLLRQHGVRSTSIDCGHSVDELADIVAAGNVVAICIAAIPPGAIVAARRLHRQLRARLPRLKISVGIWGSKDGATAIEKLLGKPGPDGVATTLGDAVAQITRIIDTAAPAIEAEKGGGFDLEVGAEPSVEDVYEAVRRKLAEVFELPLSHVCIVDTDHAFWREHSGLASDLSKQESLPPSQALCEQVSMEDEVLIVEDLAEDLRFANNPYVTDRGIRFFAGVRLRTPKGHGVGTLCVIDVKPHEATPEQVAILSSVAGQMMEHLEKSRKDEAEER